MSTFRADLHIHSCLSPCGDLESSPRAIARAATSLGLNLIALTDHNSARNIPAFATACRNEGISAVYGIEVTTREEVHVLTLFASPEVALAAGEEIYERLISSTFDPELFGDQVYVNDDEEIEGTLEKLLILGATDFSIEELGSWCRTKGGLIIPAHINRPSFGVLAQLGILPEGPFNAVETTEPLNPSLTNPWPVICSSDAHSLGSIGLRHIEFGAPSPDFDSLAAALATNDVRPIFPNS